MKNFQYLKCKNIESYNLSYNIIDIKENSRWYVFLFNININVVIILVNVYTYFKKLVLQVLNKTANILIYNKKNVVCLLETIQQTIFLIFNNFN